MVRTHVETVQFPIQGSTTSHQRIDMIGEYAQQHTGCVSYVPDDDAPDIEPGHVKDPAGRGVGEKSQLFP